MKDDTISRQAAIDTIREMPPELFSAYQHNAYIDKQGAMIRIMAMLSAQPERKRGKWAKVGHWGRVYKCDQCLNYLDFDGVNGGRGSANFCPNCGADMREEGEQDVGRKVL